MSKVIAELLSVAIQSSPRIKEMLVLLPGSQPSAASALFKIVIRWGLESVIRTVFKEARIDFCIIIES